MQCSVFAPITNSIHLNGQDFEGLGCVSWRPCLHFLMAAPQLALSVGISCGQLCCLGELTGQQLVHC